jgi:hypothetical protein
MAATARAIQVTGLRELRRDLRRLDATLPRELAQINQRAAEIVATEARRRAPRGPHQGGGRVAPIVSSIKALRQQGRGVVAIGGVRSPHAVVTEFGGTIPRRGSHRGQVAQAQAMHQSFRRFGGISVTRVRKQAYVYPALDAKRDEVVNAYADMLDDLLRRAAHAA